MQQQKAAANVQRKTVSSGVKTKQGLYHGGTMSSSRSSEVDWQRPAWGANNKYNKTFDDATRYNINRYTESRPASQMSINPTESYEDKRSPSKANRSRPSSAKKNNFKPSYVDDLLFGSKVAEPDLSAPWNVSVATKGHAFDYTDYKEQGTNCSRSSRPGSRTCVPRHSASYVDESLFGPKLADPGWDAPWNKPEPKRIHMFDEFQHKVTIQHNDVEILRPKSSVYMRKPRPVSSGKPVWR
jgi:hypothetical protein